MLKQILPKLEDIAMTLPGDERLKNPLVIIDSAFELPASPEEVYPWFV